MSKKKTITMNKMRHIKMMWFVIGICFLIMVLSAEAQPLFSLCWIGFAYLAYRSAKNTTTEILNGSQ